MATKFGNKGGATPATGKARNNPFAGVDPNGGGARLPRLPFDSTSTVRIDSTERKTMSGDNVVTEFTIVESDNAGVKAGAQYAYVQALGDQWGYGAAAFTRMVIAAGNLNEAEIATLLAEAAEGLSIVNAACGDADACAKHGENPIAGATVRVHCTRGKEDGKGGHYPEYTFSPVE